MIAIEIIEAKNPDRIGSYTFYHNKINLGSSIKDHIFIEDESMVSSHLNFFIENDKLYVSFNETVKQIHVNKKISTATKILKKNDIVEVDTLSLKILDYSLTCFPGKKDYLNKRVQELPAKAPELIELLQELAE